ncbi:MAG TPA: bacillithiol biosynthesis deacetylase BshB1 [Chitinophagaceae bacterium]|nr:bacillithiol biosynthesis deacetylase BshB1 [Chitinophagaceae bacterium]
MKLDLLAFGVHPDDIELSCAGTLLVEKSKGKKAGVIDLTRGELGTRGDAETRKHEAKISADILGLDIRENLNMADGFFENNEENKRKIIRVLRKYQPEIIICNAVDDRHPDHGRSARLVSDAAFLSGLVKIKTQGEDGRDQAAWRPKYVFNYIQDLYLHPDFVIDISDVFETKLRSIEAFESQFYTPAANDRNGEPQTYISSPEFLESVINRSKMFGRMIGVKYAEGFISKKMIGVKTFDVLIQKNT